MLAMHSAMAPAPKINRERGTSTGSFGVFSICLPSSFRLAILLKCSNIDRTSDTKCLLRLVERRITFSLQLRRHGVLASLVQNIGVSNLRRSISWIVGSGWSYLTSAR
jgi:hypothetical protein